MNFDSAAFGLFALVAILVLNLFRKSEPRHWFVLILNVVFIATFVATPLGVVPFIGFLIVGYGAIAAAGFVGSRGLLALVAIVIFLFAWLKKYTIIAFLPNIEMLYLQVGLSYILFRILHLMIDVNQKVTPRPGLIAYLSYVTFFLSFVSGPIQRYEDFAFQMASPKFPATVESMNLAFNRILRGLLLILVTSFTLILFSQREQHLHEALTPGHHGMSPVIEFSITAAVFLIHLYLNFVAYMEIVIGLGILCGFQLPENFNRPYLAQNFLDLWSRWHITLSEWFKFYLFNPVLKTLAERWPSPKLIPYFGAVAFFITFTIMGIWHGSTPIFLIYGAALGIGAAGNKLFQIYAVSRLGKKRYRALSERAWYRHFSRGATLAFFTVGVACVWITPEIAALIMRVGGVELVSLSFGFLLLVYAFLSWLADLVSRVRLPTVESFRRPDWSLPVTTGLKLFFIINAIIVLDTATPEFVYKVF